MLNQKFPAVNVNGMQINHDGSPSTRALASMINAVINQLNTLADDINTMRPQLNAMQVAIDQINRNTAPAPHLQSAGAMRAAGPVSAATGVSQGYKTQVPYKPFNPR